MKTFIDNKTMIRKVKGGLSDLEIIEYSKCVMGYAPYNQEILNGVQKHIDIVREDHCPYKGVSQLQPATVREHNEQYEHYEGC